MEKCCRTYQLILLNCCSNTWYPFPPFNGLPSPVEWISREVSIAIWSRPFLHNSQVLTRYGNCPACYWGSAKYIYTQGGLRLLFSRVSIRHTPYHTRRFHPTLQYTIPRRQPLSSAFTHPRTLPRSDRHFATPSCSFFCPSQPATYRQSSCLSVEMRTVHHSNVPMKARSRFFLPWQDINCIDRPYQACLYGSWAVGRHIRTPTTWKTS